MGFKGIKFQNEMCQENEQKYTHTKAILLGNFRTGNKNILQTSKEKNQVSYKGL